MKPHRYKIALKDLDFLSRMNLKQLNSASQKTPTQNIDTYRSTIQASDAELVKQKLMDKSME